MSGHRITIPHFSRDIGLYFSLALLGWILLILVLSLQFPERARLFPLIIGGIGLPLIVIVVLGRIFVTLSRKVDALEGGTGVFDTNTANEMMAKVGKVKEENLSYRALMALFLWFGGCAALFFLVGYLPAMVIFLLLFLKCYGLYSFKATISMTAGLVIPFWIMFSQFLNLPPFAGVLW